MLSREINKHSLIFYDYFAYIYIENRKKFCIKILLCNILKDTGLSFL